MSIFTPRTSALLGLLLFAAGCASPGDPGSQETVSIRVAGFVETAGIT